MRGIVGRVVKMVVQSQDRGEGVDRDGDGRPDDGERGRKSRADREMLKKAKTAAKIGRGLLR